MKRIAPNGDPGGCFLNLSGNWTVGDRWVIFIYVFIRSDKFFVPDRPKKLASKSEPRVQRGSKTYIYL